MYSICIVQMLSLIILCCILISTLTELGIIVVGKLNIINNNLFNPLNEKINFVM